MVVVILGFKKGQSFLFKLRPLHSLYYHQFRLQFVFLVLLLKELSSFLFIQIAQLFVVLESTFKFKFDSIDILLSRNGVQKLINFSLDADLFASQLLDSYLSISEGQLLQSLVSHEVILFNSFDFIPVYLVEFSIESFSPVTILVVSIFAITSDLVILAIEFLMKSFDSHSGFI